MAESDGAIFNNAGQTLNHNLYFTQFSPYGGGRPTGALAKAIDATWGSFENFQKEFVAAGTGLFGSGWVWLDYRNRRPDHLNALWKIIDWDTVGKRY